MKRVFSSFIAAVCTVVLMPAFCQDIPTCNAPDVMPEFQGGESLSLWLQKHVSYPADALERGEHGRVLVDFIVETDGSLSSFKILKSVSPMLDAEALRVAKTMPRFKPGKKNGVACRVKYTLPVNFTLDDDRAPSRQGAVREHNVYLIRKNIVAGIMMDMLVSKIPQSIDGLYDRISKTGDETSQTYVLSLYQGDARVMDITCRTEQGRNDAENDRIESIIVYSPDMSTLDGIHPGLGLGELMDKYHVDVSYISSGKNGEEGELCVTDDSGSFFRLNLKGTLRQEARERLRKIREMVCDDDSILKIPISSSDISEGEVKSIYVIYMP